MIKYFQPSFNYTADHFYFVTLITSFKKLHFGQVTTNTMLLNQSGLLARQIWHEHIERYAYIYPHKLIIMPNHLHVIIEFRRDRLMPCDSVISLPKFIAQYKSKSTVLIHKAGLTDFSWQSGFYDHIIRNQQSFTELSHYIDTNPVNWYTDKLFVIT